MRTEISLSDPLLFGADAAEDDFHLNKYFYESQVYKRVKSGELLIVLGRKGTGKSAIFKRLSMEKGSTKYVPLTPNKFAIDIFNSYVKKYPDSPFSNETAYANAWRYTILFEILMSVEKGGTLICGPASSLHNWLRKNAEFDLDIISRAINFLESWTVSKASLGELELAKVDKSKREKIEGAQIEDAIAPLNDYLKDRKVHVLIDNLDEGWSNNEKSNAFLMGLIMAARDLQSISEHLKVSLFLRTEIYRHLELNYQHLDKFRQSIDYISWNPTSLSRLVALRIQNYFGVTSESNDASWNRIFAREMPNRFPTYKHMIERTLLRPRELIQFCRLCANISTRYKKRKIEAKDIYEAELEYSDWKIKDLCGEYSSIYKGLDVLIEYFRKPKWVYFDDEVDKILEQVIRESKLYRVDGREITLPMIKELLYQCGFLRAKVKDSRGKEIYIVSSTEPNLLIQKISKWDIHPAFREKLVIKPKSR